MILQNIYPASYVGLIELKVGITQYKIATLIFWHTFKHYFFSTLQ